MKRKISAFLAALMLFSAFSVFAFNRESSYAADLSISVYIDGEEIPLDIAPFIKNNSTLIPLRGVFEKLGATVEWDKELRQAIVKTDDVEILLCVDRDVALSNGRAVVLNVPSMLVNSKTMVPIRFVAETLGHKVNWDGNARRIDILSNKGKVQADIELPVIGSKKVFDGLLEYNNLLNEYDNIRFDVMPGVAVDSIAGSAPGAASPAPTLQEAMDSGGAGNGASAKSDHSSTNVQVEGVDEGDIIKTDGKYIYTLNQSKLYIIDSNPTAPEIISTIDTDDGRGSVSEILVREDKLVLIGSGSVNYGYPDNIVKDSAIAKITMPEYYYTNTTFMLIYDISNKKSPKLIKDMDIEGNFVSSRLIEDKLYFVTNKYFSYWGIMPMRDNITEDVLDYQIRPKYADNLTGEITVMDFSDIKYFPDYITQNFMMTVGVDINTGEADISAYLGNAETVYASQDNMYLAFRKYEHERVNALVYSRRLKISTSVYKFKLDSGRMEFIADGRVPGVLNNQFSLDEYNGNLRIATTVGEMWDSKNPSTNDIYVLDTELKKIGELTGLAPGEKIYSTRFSGDRIYMVTFKQVDPFFVIDASEPSSPKMLGYLKIPGFSTYMHILDKNHILGFGSDTVEDQYGNARTGGLKISLFDVTDPSNPVEKDKEVIGVAGTYSEIQNNHKALMIDLDKGLMAFPINVADKTPYSTSYNGAYVYNISNSSFDFRGSITHETAKTKPRDDAGYYYYYSDNIYRVVYIGDYLYSLSPGKMLVTKIKDMQSVGELEFTE